MLLTNRGLNSGAYKIAIVKASYSLTMAHSFPLTSTHMYAVANVFLHTHDHIYTFTTFHIPRHLRIRKVMKTRSSLIFASIYSGSGKTCKSDSPYILRYFDVDCLWDQLFKAQHWPLQPLDGSCLPINGTFSVVNRTLGLEMPVALILNKV